MQKARGVEGSKRRASLPPAARTEAVQWHSRKLIGGPKRGRSSLSTPRVEPHTPIESPRAALKSIISERRSFYELSVDEQ